jgi:hypothetical protein
VGGELRTGLLVRAVLSLLIYFGFVSWIVL